MTDKGPRIKKIPDGDTRERTVCPECDYIEYKNPLVVNVIVAVYGDEFLLCRRAIDPRKGFWTLPGGYMENGESPQDGAAREAKEEAGVNIKTGALIALYQPQKKNEVMMIFRGELPSREAVAGVESLEVKFFKWDDIPWKELAFPFIPEALLAYKNTKDKTEFQPVLIEGKPYIKPVSPAPKPPGM
jgi:ADP-ribose pyrophosphatase YjhB (NUDIX family)